MPRPFYTVVCKLKVSKIKADETTQPGLQMYQPVSTFIMEKKLVLRLNRIHHDKLFWMSSL